MTQDRMLDRIEVTGFKSIRKLELDLSSLNVLIGANGAGKSNFIALFELLNHIVGGKFQSFVARAGGAESFLYYGQKVTENIYVKLNFGPNSYECTWLPTVNDELFFDEEVSSLHAYGHPTKHYMGSGHKESKLAIRSKYNIGNNPTNIEAYVLDSLKSWKVYHFHDTSVSAAVKKPIDINDNIYLRHDASNLAAFLYLLKETKIEHYEAIRDTIRLVTPFFDDFFLEPDRKNENMIKLGWREKGSDFPFQAYHLSDGTLRFICLATLLLQPEMPSTILIDEPELGLHPYAIVVLASLMKSAAKRTQLIVSTQSVSLVNQFDAEDLLVVERNECDHKYETVIERVDSEKLGAWLEEYALGELWEKNVLGGRP
jgi:predicted ATPase